MANSVGRKIIQVYPDENTFLKPPEPTIGLTTRRSKSAGLRIITENHGNSLDTLKVPTSVRGSRRSSAEGHSTMTPNSTFTFGRPDPAFATAAPDSCNSEGDDPSSISSVDSAQIKRHRRYSREESALQTVLQQTAATELPHSELQVRALGQATALLSAHAKDAQQRAAKLRLSLDDRNLDPEAYQSLQRERWMEERRSQARFEESKALKALLLELSTPSGPESILDASKLHEFKEKQAESLEVKREANLAQFSKRSPTHLAFPHRRDQHAPQARRMQVSMSSITISDIRPMRLRPSALVKALSRPIKPHHRTRSTSLDGGSRLHHQAAKAHRKRGRSTSSLQPSSSSVLSLTGTPTSPTTKMPLQDAQIYPAPEVSVEGTAMIYGQASPPTLEEAMAGMTDVGLPEYALDLLDNFEEFKPHSFALRSPSEQALSSNAHAFTQSFSSHVLITMLPPPTPPPPPPQVLPSHPPSHLQTQYLPPSHSASSSSTPEPASTSQPNSQQAKARSGSHFNIHLFGAGKPSGLRRPISAFFSPPSSPRASGPSQHTRHKSQDSDMFNFQAGPYISKFVERDNSEARLDGQSQTLISDGKQPAERERSVDVDRKQRWSIPAAGVGNHTNEGRSRPSSPSRVFAKMRHRLSAFGGKKDKLRQV